MAKQKASAPKEKKRSAPTVRTYICVYECYFQKRTFKPTGPKAGFHRFPADLKLPTHQGEPCFKEVSMGHSPQAEIAPKARKVPAGPYIRPENEIPVRQVVGKGGVSYGVPIKPHGSIIE